MILRSILVSALALVPGAMTPVRAQGAHLLLGPGFGPFRDLPGRGFGSLELNLPVLSTWLGAWATLDASTEGKYIGLGPLLQVRPGGPWILGASTGPGWFSNDTDLNLGSKLEFRSTFYVLAELPGGFQSGFSISHYSNGGIAHHNPGAETVRLLLGIPLGAKRR